MGYSVMEVRVMVRNLLGGSNPTNTLTNQGLAIILIVHDGNLFSIVDLYIIQILSKCWSLLSDKTEKY